MKRSFEIASPFPIELLTASIALVVMGIFVVLLQYREVFPKAEREVLLSMAGEFRRSWSTVERINESILSQSTPAVEELNGVLEQLFSEGGALSDEGKIELAKVAKELRSGRAALQIRYVIPESSLFNFLGYEERALRVEEFLVAEGAPRFLVSLELVFGEREAVSLRFRKAPDRVRWL